MNCEKLLESIKIKYCGNDQNFLILFLVKEERGFRAKGLIQDIIRYRIASGIDIKNEKTFYLVSHLINTWGLRESFFLGVSLGGSSSDRSWDDMEFLTDAIRHRGLPKGTILGLENRELGEDGARYISEMLKVTGFPEDLQLDLSDNEIGDRGVKHIADAIEARGLNKGVKIYLFQNKISDEGIEYLLNAIKKVGLREGVTIFIGNNPNIGKMRKELRDYAKSQGFIPWETFDTFYKPDKPIFR